MSDEIQRAQQAEHILGHDLFKEAVQVMRDKAIEEFRKAKPSEPQALLVARLRYEMTEEFVNAFQLMVRDGVYAARKKARAEPPKTHPANMSGQVQ